ncbi:MAG TPA: isoprenylcysteine carboxylmethyltransferase family protein [Cellulomonas sp.]|uniref:methyltransferase family protein n=1 Tax=Cellulomonas sp. TaxID=40001 RepID=UPI002E32876D|nr:isoprenylcysteine carboxylmethyltransferase family protein [Cellulomonas sp.]HEX5332936.1 isoprenylcysteine carboxylmethyltransferase family protein [Cellulomonas sp.]
MRVPDDRVIARLLVAGQGVLLVLLVVVPGRGGWSVPGALVVLSGVGTAVGLGIVLVGGTALGRGLTATPLPNEHAQLRTTGLYRFVRHPIYSGLLLASAAFTLGTGSVTRLVVLVLLVLLLTMKARWEEVRLARRFDGYAAYAARTPRFVPVRPHRSPDRCVDDSTVT